MRGLAAIPCHTGRVQAPFKVLGPGFWVLGSGSWSLCFALLCLVAWCVFRHCVAHRPCWGACFQEYLTLPYAAVTFSLFAASTSTVHQSPQSVRLPCPTRYETQVQTARCDLNVAPSQRPPPYDFWGGFFLLESCLFLQSRFLAHFSLLLTNKRPRSVLIAAPSVARLFRSDHRNTTFRTATMTRPRRSSAASEESDGTAGQQVRIFRHLDSMSKKGPDMLTGCAGAGEHVRLPRQDHPLGT